MQTNQRRFYYYRLLSFALYAIPLGLLLVLKKNVYFTQPKVSLSIWGYIIAMFLILTFKKSIKSLSESNMILTLSVVLFIFSVLMREIATQIAIISLMSIIGCVLYSITYRVAEVYRDAVWKSHEGVVKKIRSESITHKKAWVLAYLGHDLPNNEDLGV